MILNYRVIIIVISKDRFHYKFMIFLIDTKVEYIDVLKKKKNNS
jgi:hypothetical protein